MRTLIESLTVTQNQQMHIGHGLGCQSQGRQLVLAKAVWHWWGKDAWAAQSRGRGTRLEGQGAEAGAQLCRSPGKKLVALLLQRGLLKEREVSLLLSQIW